MAWTVEFTPAAERELGKLDRQAAHRIVSYLQEVVTSCSDPRQRGKGLTANKTGLWRYRVGDYRLICQLEDARLVVLVVRVSHRSEAYC
ncbi:type II toxin-antitoxin system RelE/ParE family toxin [Synechococcus sp. 1G10]|uniref:type II toxin-antitoxin system RelE family toxin n=1 Tax=Synechococcus sp. 1G10 TaxID=2025605 RepID=UPI000B9855B9|nr:type II toxin-antitoxin system RelE/ParE family toxin [Synechococcus sp. 1G10]